jgi:uncharacterized protein YecE (DUF72 family)
LVVADTAGKWPLLFDVTADVVYVRLHGDEALYVSGYSDDALRTWAGRIRDWADDGQDVFVYFDNDVKVHAPFDAHALMRLLGADVPVHMPDVRERRASLPYEARRDMPAGLRPRS